MYEKAKQEEKEEDDQNLKMDENPFNDTKFLDVDDVNLSIILDFSLIFLKNRKNLTMKLKNYWNGLTT